MAYRIMLFPTALIDRSSRPFKAISHIVVQQLARFDEIWSDTKHSAVRLYIILRRALTAVAEPFVGLWIYIVKFVYEAYDTLLNFADFSSCTYGWEQLQYSILCWTGIASCLCAGTLTRIHQTVVKPRDDSAKFQSLIRFWPTVTIVYLLRIKKIP